MAAIQDRPPTSALSTSPAPDAPARPDPARPDERRRLQALRAERLARLRFEAAAPAPRAAVLRFHRPAPVTAPVPAPAPAAAPVSDLDRLPGVGPDLVWALTRAGLARRADLAPLEASELAARLGPIGRLAPVAAWIADARAAARAEA